MGWSIDGRVPVGIAMDRPALDRALAAGPAAAVLAEAGGSRPPPAAVAVGEFVATAPHAMGCACCAGRPPVAVALDRLFQARVRGQCGWFDRVLVLARTPGAREAVAGALVHDALTAARFRAAV